LQVLQLVANGFTNAEIAQSLAISRQTTKNHLSAIYDKLGTVNRTQAAIRAVELGFARTAMEGASGSDRTSSHGSH